MKHVLLIFLLPVQLAVAQSEIHLDSCYVWARNNYPNLKQSELWQEFTSLKQQNLAKNNMPRVTLNGQATYQSAVTQLPISIAGVNIPTVSKDRYNAYAELQQNIWDGGLTQSNKALEDAILKSRLSELEVELYKLKEQVAQAFFTILITAKQTAVIQAQIKTINERLKMVNSAIKNGAMEKSDALVLQAEILHLEQSKVELAAAKNAAVQMLSILTGEKLSENSNYAFTPIPAVINADLLRPEIDFFASQHDQLDRQKTALSKNRNPKLFGFGKVGYGKPGLNVLLDEFKGYYLLGVGVSWNAFDWKTTSREKQVLQVQQEMLRSQEATFRQSIQLLLAQQNAQISKLRTMLENDKKMVALRTDITQSAASKLENETITTSDYIQELQAETVARQNLELHKIQLNQAWEKYHLIKGK